MKKIITFLLLSTPVLVHAQNTFPTTGNVGIGTSSPTAILEVNNNNQPYYVNRTISGSTESYTGKAYLLLFIASESDGGRARVWGKFSAISTAPWQDPYPKATWSVEVNSSTTNFIGNTISYNKGVQLVSVKYNNRYYVAIELARNLLLHSFSFTGYAQNEQIMLVSEESITSATVVPLEAMFIGGRLHIGNPMLSSSQFYVKGNFSSLNDVGDNDPVGAGITVEASGSTTTGPALEFATSQNGDAPFAPWGRSRIISITNTTVDDGTGKMILGTRRVMDKGDGPLWHYGDDLVIDGTGNVGIGTLKPSGKLSVNGTIVAKKIKISQSATDWPDYVFNKSYKLPSLDSVEAFIRTNKHLPEVPAAKVAEADGIDVSEMQKVLLKKIEELTLYLLESKKRSDDQQIELEGIKKENKILKEKIEKLHISRE